LKPHESSERAPVLTLTASLVMLLALIGCSVAPATHTGTGGIAGGTGGAGGAAVVSCGSDNPDDLISDFAINNGIDPVDGRSGGWYVYGDANGAFTPPKNPDPTIAYPIDMTVGNTACSGAGSFHVKGTGFNIWGAATGTDFVAPVGKAADGTNLKGPYDATKYRGISFWAKATMPLSYVQVKFPDLNTDPEVQSPVCILSAGGLSNNCSPYLIKFSNPDDTSYPAYANTKIDTIWRRFDVMFADAKQDTFNTGYVPTPNQLDTAHLLGFAIQVNSDFSTYPVSANDFEIWIDDVRFIR
jgi:hypothetical protein